MAQQRYVAYYRVSTAQQGHSGLGLEAQRAAVERLIGTNSGSLLAEFTEIVSGAKEQPVMREALRVCHTYEATLVVARLDRLSRNVATITQLMESDVEFIVADFPEANRFTLHILAAVAEYELKLISERIRAVMKLLKARGVKFGGYRPGWDASRRKGSARALVVRRARAKARAIELAPLACELRDRGLCVFAIANELTRMEIRAPNGKAKWYPSSVVRIFALSSQTPPHARQMRGKRPKGLPVLELLGSARTDYQIQF